MASNAKPKKKKQVGFTAADWPETGDLTEHGFCRGCSSWWCPHASPELYKPRELKRFYDGRGPRRA